MMFGRRVVIAWFLALLALAAPSLAEDGKPADGAGNFIQALADKSIAELTEEGISIEERRKRFRVILNKEFAVKTIGRWVLGRYWSQATEDQQKEYMRLFENLLVVTYADRFADYKGEKLLVQKALTKGPEDIIVYSVIKKPNEPEPVELQWRVREKDGRYLIIDVMVAGISMSQSQRSEFASIINRHGGDMTLFLDEMRNQKTFGKLQTNAVKPE